MTQLRFLITDDHWIARAAIASLLPMIGRDVIADEAATASEAKALMAQHTYDLLILDLNLPDATPWELVASAREQAPESPIVIVSVSEAREDVLKCLQHGISAYVPKNSSPEQILSALRRSLDGEVSLPRRLLSNPAPESRSAMKTDGDFARICTQVDDLTNRQREVFFQLAENRTNAEIAEELGLSPNTVRVHLQALSSRLNTKQRAKLAAYAARCRSEYCASVA